MSDPRPSRAPSDASLLAELQALDRMPRTGWLMRGVPDAESVAEHSFHVAFLVWWLGRRIDRLDLTKALELALVHDLAALELGDIPRVGARYLPDGAKQQAEQAIFTTLLGADATALLTEYQQGSSREARLVKLCDRIQTVIKAGVYESWGHPAAAELGNALEELDGEEFPIVAALIDELRHNKEKELNR
ncbi:MAG: HD domain-containing protein [Acidobacteriota bacterium]